MKLSRDVDGDDLVKALHVKAAQVVRRQQQRQWRYLGPESGPVPASCPHFIEGPMRV